jgi:hypothetical protein
MKSFFKKKIVTTIIDYLSSPFSLFAVVWLKPISVMLRFLPVNNKIFMRFGLLPVRDHYYQPLINACKRLKKSLREDRHLPGINLNIDEQLNILNAFDFNQELARFPLQKINDLEYYFTNSSFESGDAEFLFLSESHLIVIPFLNLNFFMKLISKN